MHRVNNLRSENTPIHIQTSPKFWQNEPDFHPTDPAL